MLWVTRVLNTCGKYNKLPVEEPGIVYCEENLLSLQLDQKKQEEEALKHL